MAALTSNRSTDQYGGIGSGVLPNRYFLPVAAAAHIYEGALVALDAAGNANPAGAGASFPTVIGRSDQEADNTTGAAAAIGVEVRQGAFKWDVSGSLTKASFGVKVYAVDDHTIILSNAGANTACAGMFMGYDATDPVSPTQAIVLTVGAGSFGALT